MKKTLFGALMAVAISIGFTQVDAAPIHEAAWAGNVETLQQLLQAPGVDVNAEDINRATPLMHAAYNGHINAVNLLLAAPNIDVNAKDKHAWTALMTAARRAHADIVSRLLEVPGIEINAQNDNNQTALDLTNNNQARELIENHIFNTTRGPKTKSARN